MLSALKAAPGVAFRIVGSGPLEASLRSRAEREGISNAEFLGYRSGDELASIVRGALFTVVPSECYENSPLTVYESFAYGKAVVGSRIGGIPELVTENETGLIFEPGDARGLAACLQSMWDDRARSVEMGRAARLRVEREYGPERHYERIMEIYERAMS
jgi:glycosyltransferase involved in cell wall biosynthesis